MKSQVCILTDSTAQFPTPIFPGRELVTILPMHTSLNGQETIDERDLRLIHLPVSARNGLHPQVHPPSLIEFKQAFNRLEQDYEDIILILLSSHLNPAVAYADQATSQANTSANLHLVDSQTTAAGLGWLVQMAAEMAAQGFPAAEILRQVRGFIGHVYTLFCVYNLTYLSHSGQLDPAQALVGEMLGLISFFLLENGRLVPIQKARSSRQLVDTFHEFASEFSHLKHLALLQGLPQFTNEVRNLHERISQDFPNTPYSEHYISVALGMILGPRSLGLVAIEDTNPNGHRDCHR